MLYPLTYFLFLYEVAPITFPSEGSESWEINQLLAKAFQKDKLTLHIQTFVYVCAMHFQKTHPDGRKPTHYTENTLK
jgi:hypothetical protein